MALLVGVSTTALAGPAHADLPLLLEPPAYNFAGQTGLLDMPTARFQADGEMSATVSSMHAIDRYSLGFQALPWLETTFRYSRIDRLLSGGRDLYDRSLGVKIRLSQETDFWPSIAIGTQDILGTGQQEADYLVASKRVGTLDFTLGMGWRRFSGFASFDNPLGQLFPSFKKTDNSVSTGVPLVGQLFHGPRAGLFGGVSWQTPIEGLQLLLEVSGDKYQTQQQRGAIDIRTPLNIGFSYEPWNGVQIGAGYLYGSAFGARITLHMNPFDPEPSVRLGEQPTPMVVRTPEARQDAVLDILQDKTHYYANWPSRNASGQQAVVSKAPALQSAQSSLGLVDAVFNDAEKSNIALANAEAYGDSLIFDVRGKGPLSCSAFTGIDEIALNAGFHQIALTSRNEVKICDLKAANNTSGNNNIIAVSAIENPEGDEPAPDTEPGLTSKPPITGQDLKARILKKANAQGIFIQSITISSTRIDVAFGNGQYRAQAEAIGRLLRILMSEAPDSVEDFRLVSLVGYMPTLGWTFHRSDIERIYTNDGQASELLPVTEMSAVPADDSVVAQYSELKFPRFSWSVGPGLHQSYFDPNNPYNFAVYASISAGVDITHNLTLSGDVEANIYTTFTNDTRVSDSLLPHVRTDFVSYYQKGKNGINSLQASYFTKLSPDVYAVGRAGYLESMFAGAGGEILWQPPHQRWAIGASLYGVQQRAFDRLFGLRDYKVITGHVGLYYASPIYGLDFALYAGRYLAGDYGATFEIRRHFDNGVEVGVYATLTNVPFHIYGEGSFDKGFIIRIPLDFLAPINTQRELNLDFTPLTRDGGQRLDDEQTLFYGLQRASERGMLENWQDVLRP